MPTRQYRKRLLRHTDPDLSLRYYAALHQALCCALYGRAIRFFDTASAATITLFLIDLFFLADYYCVGEEAMYTIKDALYDQVRVYQDVKDQPEFYIWLAHYFTEPELLIEAMRHAAGHNDLACAHKRFRAWSCSIEIPTEHLTLAAYAHTSLMQHVGQLRCGLQKCIHDWYMSRVEHSAERLLWTHHKQPVALTRVSKLRNGTCIRISELRRWLRGEPDIDLTYWTGLLYIAGSTIHQCIVPRFTFLSIEHDGQTIIADSTEASSYLQLYKACQNRNFDLWEPGLLAMIASKLHINLNHLHQASDTVLEELQRCFDSSPLFQTCKGSGYCPNSPDHAFPSCEICDLRWCDCSSDDVNDEDELCPCEVYDDRFRYILPHRKLRAGDEPDDRFTYLDYPCR